MSNPPPPPTHSTKGTVTIMRAKKTTLRHRLHTDDDEFIDFVGSLLTYDQIARPSALEALRHPFICHNDEIMQELEEFETDLRGDEVADRSVRFFSKSLGPCTPSLCVVPGFVYAHVDPLQRTDVVLMGVLLSIA